MFDKLIERRSALTDTRVKTFVEAKQHYEGFLGERQIPFDHMDTADYRRAADDMRLKVARQGFADSASMSRNEGVLADEAIALYQLGMVCHACGELEESAKHLHAALDVLQNLTVEERLAVKSGCHYHLGVIAWKNNEDDKAVSHLLESRRIDESIVDISGMQLCDSVLEKCNRKQIDRASSVNTAGLNSHIREKPRPRDWKPPEDDTSQTSGDYVDPEYDEILEKPARVHYNQRQVIWLASYSIEANDRIMHHLEMFGDEFGRPVTISRVAFGSENQEQASLPQHDQGQHLCAAILVLEKAGISNTHFQDLAAVCIERVLDRPDFRLLVYLDDLKIEDLRDLQEREPFLKNLFDTTQVAELPSLKQLRNTLVPFVRRVERIQAMEWWRQIRLYAQRVFGKIATIMLFAAAAVSILGFPAWLSHFRIDDYLPYGKELSALILGLVAFPVQAPFVFILLRGLRRTVIAPRDNRYFIPWTVMGGVILAGSTHLQHAHGGPTSWIVLGLVYGVILDTIRRRGYQARREMVDVTAHSRAISESTRNEQVKPPESPCNPFTCPILPSLSTKVFISYSRSSEKGSRIARVLYTRLKEAGTAPFLDRASIPAGTSWRRSLNRHVGECDVFISLLDDKSVSREWVAAEMTAAIEGRNIASAPHIIVLADPDIQELPPDTKPVFKAIMSTENRSDEFNQPRIVYVNDRTVEAIAWDLRPGRFVSTAVLPRSAAMMVMSVLAIVGLLGGLGMVMGFVLGFLAVLEKWASFPFSHWIVSHSVQAPLVILTGLWLGWTARMAIIWGFEDRFYRQEGVIPCSIASVGLAFVLVVVTPETTLYVATWSAAFVLAGWMTVGSLTHSGFTRKEKILSA